MFLVNPSQVVEMLVHRAKELAGGCNKVFVAVSGGVDSAVVLMVLIEAFGAEKVVGLFRNIKNKPEHREDVLALGKHFSFHLLDVDANDLYEEFLARCRAAFLTSGLPWYDEGSDEALAHHWENAYASLKSRFTTPMAGFISKAIDDGRGRIFGTGNAEEDVLLRYFDKYGDGAVDNNIINGLTKCEVRQLALYFSRKYQCQVLQKIAYNLPSADLYGTGDAHNDEAELSSWAKAMGYNLSLSYGSPQQEGNIAWVLKQNMDRGIVDGVHENTSLSELKKLYSYTDEEIQLIDVIRRLEKSSRHKVLSPPGLPRRELRELGVVD